MATDTTARRSLRAALTLLAVASVTFGVVALVHERTRADIAAAARARQQEQFVAVLAGRPFDNDPLQDVVELRDVELLGTAAPVPVHRARQQGQPVAVIIAAVAPDGYSGPIELLVGIAPDGRLLGVRVTRHRETPGLGDFIELRRSDWIQQFAGRSLQSPTLARWQVRRDGGDFDQFTGATVTPRAVVTAVARTLQAFERHREALLAPAGTIPP
jgi:Na+-translocating ferredoxin:NAD+ oxidoreductase subunit G